MKPIMRCLVLGGGGFIGSHLVSRLVGEGHYVRAVDLKHPEWSRSPANDFVIGDLRDSAITSQVFEGHHWDEVYQLAADMGGAGFVFTGVNDADIMHNNALINLNCLNAANPRRVGTYFYSSSACIYPARNQTDPDDPRCSEDSAYPADPDSEYGWEKLFSERMALSFSRCRGLNVRIARYHNIFGPEGTYQGGREKAPAALCRKVAQAAEDSCIEIWGDGLQTRSFLYIDDCIDATLQLVRHPFFVRPCQWAEVNEGVPIAMPAERIGVSDPVNIGSEEMVTIRRLAEMAIDLSGKTLGIKCIPGPQGVRGRNSDNLLVRRTLGWEPKHSLRKGLESTYAWILERSKA
jgi:GDP-D-mannose 3', 5'-epimerase